MTTPDTICFGTLFKTGGKGHTVKNQKLRWCTLQGAFLTYYHEKPDLAGKALDKLKGQLYLEGCQIRDADPSERENSFVLTTAAGKEYIFTPTIDKEECTMWKNAIFYALKKVKIFADTLVGEPLAAAWLMKKGGKGHRTQNWKKRYFVLQGQLLNYYDRVNARTDDVTGLKGWINLTEITELSSEEDPEDGCEKPHYLKISTSNEKGYFLVAKNDEEKKQWFFRIKKQLDLVIKTYDLPQTNFLVEEKELKSSFLLRLSGSEWRKTWVVVTNVNIRFYKGDARKTPSDFGKQLFETISLVGISIEEARGKGRDSILKLVDALGNSFSLNVFEPPDFRVWVDTIKKASSTLVTTIINKGESIHINCRTSADDPNDKTKRQEYTQVKLTKDTLSFFFLLSNARVEIPLKDIDKTTCVSGVFYMRYMFEGKQQELRIKSSNVQGLFSTISTVLEIYREKNKPATEPVRPSTLEEFTFKNTYLSDSFFDKMEQDVEQSVAASAQPDQPQLTENKPQPTQPVYQPTQNKPQPTQIQQPTVNKPPTVNSVSPKTAKAWVSARKPEEVAPSEHQETAPVAQAPPTVLKEKPLADPDELNQHAQELLLVRTHPKNADFPSLASEIDIDISGISNSYNNAVQPTDPNTIPLKRESIDYFPKDNDSIYGLNEQDLQDIVEVSQSEQDKEILKSARNSVYVPNFESLEPTLDGDLSASSSMTNSLVFKPDDDSLRNSSSLTNTPSNSVMNSLLAQYTPVGTPPSMTNSLVPQNTPVGSMTDSQVPSSSPLTSMNPMVPNDDTDNAPNTRTVIIKDVTVVRDTPNTPVQTPEFITVTPTLSGMLSGTTSTKTSSRRQSVDYDALYSTLRLDPPSTTTADDAVTHVERARGTSQASLEAQAMLQSIEEFLDAEPVIGGPRHPPLPKTAPPKFAPPKAPVQQQSAPLQGEPQKTPEPSMFASLDDLLKETEDLLKKTINE